VSWGTAEVVGGALMVIGSPTTGGTSAFAGTLVTAAGISNIILGATGNGSFEKPFYEQMNNISSGNVKADAYIRALNEFNMPSLVPNVTPEVFDDKDKDK
jgi:hypothetical protein